MHVCVRTEQYENITHIEDSEDGLSNGDLFLYMDKYTNQTLPKHAIMTQEEFSCKPYAPRLSLHADHRHLGLCRQLWR